MLLLFSSDGGESVGFESFDIFGKNDIGGAKRLCCTNGFGCAGDGLGGWCFKALGDL